MKETIEKMALSADRDEAMSFIKACVSAIRWYAEDTENPSWGSQDSQWTIWAFGLPVEDLDCDDVVTLRASDRDVLAILASSSVWSPTQWGLAESLVIKNAELLSAMLVEGTLPTAAELSKGV